MGDFDDLIDDAENFHGEELAEEDVDDYFVAEHKIAVTAKKRAVDDENDDNCHSASSIGKKAKIPGCLADYFIDTAEPFQSNGQQSSNTSSIEQKVVYTADSAITKQNASQNSDDDGINFGEKRPLCFCGISSMSKTTLKEGQNKNRMFWICTQPRESQCKFFEWHDEAKLSNGNGTGNVMPQSTNHQLPKLSQPQITGPLCNCQLPSIIRTTMKEGPNHKRNFWVCPASRESQCKFFKWEDAGSSDQPQKTESSYGNYNNTRQNSNDDPSNSSNAHGNSIKTYGNGSSQNISMGGGNGGVGGKGSCFKCGKEGHWSSNCLEANNGNSKGYNKGEKFGSGNNSNNNTDNSSYRDSRYSENGAKQSYSGGNGQKTGSCYKCGESGHWSSSCPKAGGGYKR